MEANRGRKKRNTIYRKTRREEEKRRQKQARKENTQKEIKRAIGRAKDKMAPDKDG
jgi:hypothetical protein